MFKNGWIYFKIVCTCLKRLLAKQCIKMKSYCLKRRKDTENIDLKVSSSSNGRAMILSNCGIYGSKKSRFIKNEEAKGLLSKLGIKTLLNKVPILGDISF